MKIASPLGSKLAILAFVVASVTALAPTAFAQIRTQTFALVPGIPGSSTDEHHAGWIEVASLSQGLSTAKKGTACDVFLGKQLDIAGPRLWLAAVTGQTFGEIRIEVVKTGEMPLKFYEVRLQNARVTNISTAGSSGGDFFESVGLTGTSMTLSFYPQKPDGTLDTPVTTNIPCN